MALNDLPAPGMRWETTSEHIARDMEEGRFPEKSERQQVPDLEMSGWKPIETAPALERVIVAGWQNPSGSTAGYWWWYEDMTDDKGIPIDHPAALMWHKPIPVPSFLPQPA